MAEHRHLACDYTANWLTIKASNATIFEKRSTENSSPTLSRRGVRRRMWILSDVRHSVPQELISSKSLKVRKNAVATNTTVPQQFFKKFECAEPVYVKYCHDEVKAFEDCLRIRAQSKREVTMEEAEAVDKNERIKADR
ncbi:hypothetical protein CRE_29135 [Caenorhabditis remanei]|uniref:Uncharacterized protein n=1 Tax=Caenorhabditis remanei TaxID=31234 RepID=E3N4J8_CAERE|nr:hypothetical protein CRE_29135 [Caenorhabditis remanei]